jgi:hypothetical protein
MKGKRTLGLVLAGLAVLLAVGFGAAGAALVDTPVNIDEPDNQQVEVDVSFSGSADATANLTSGGTEVVSQTVSGADGDTKTITLDLDGLAATEMNLHVSATDESNVTVDQTRLVTERDSQIDVVENDTVYVDVEYDSDEMVNSTVEFRNDGVVLNSTDLTFDPVDFEDGSGMKTAEWESGSDYSAVNVTVSTYPASGQETIFVSTSDDSDAIFGGGIAFGAGRNEILAFLAVVAGMVFARENGWI